MRTRKTFILFALALSIAVAAFGQERYAPLPPPCPDFLDRIKAMLSEDAKVREAASGLAECVTMLLPKDREYLDREILPLVRRALASSIAQVRVHATAIPGMLTMFRDDTAEVLDSFVPIMVEAFYDRHPDVQQNSILAVANLRPGPPPTAAKPLAHLLENPEIVGSRREHAFGGLARISPMTDGIAEVLEREVARTKDPLGKGHLLRFLGETRDLHPRILSILTGSLDAHEPYVVERAIEGLMNLGPAAAEAAPALRKIAAERRFGEQIAEFAARAADRVEAKQRQR